MIPIFRQVASNTFLSIIERSCFWANTCIFFCRVNKGFRARLRRNNGSISCSIWHGAISSNKWKGSISLNSKFGTHVYLEVKLITLRACLTGFFLVRPEIRHCASKTFLTIIEWCLSRANASLCDWIVDKVSFALYISFNTNSFCFIIDFSTRTANTFFSIEKWCRLRAISTLQLINAVVLSSRATLTFFTV